MDDRLFVNVAGFGIDAYVAAQFDKPGNRRRGFAGYAAITARALASYVPQTYTITTAEGRRVSRAILVTRGELRAIRQRSPNRASAPSSTMACWIWSSWRSAPGGGRSSACRGSSTEPWRQIPGCSICRIQQATIESDRPMVFHVDGEPVEGGTRLQVRVLPAALRVAVR